MAEIIRYIESNGTTHTLTTANVKYVSGEGLDAWPVKPIWDELTGDTALLGGWEHNRREIRLRFAINADTYDNARGTVRTWRQWFFRDVNRGLAGTVQVVLDNGGTYSIAAAISESDVGEPQYTYNDVTLAFEASSLYWKYGATQSTASAFNGTVAVDVGYNNTGDYQTYPVHIITGPIGTPTIANPVTNEMIQVGTAMAGSADVMYIWTNPVLIRYYAGGTAAGDKNQGANWTGYAGTVSDFWALGMNAGTVRLTAASGAATYQLQYDIRKAGLG